MRAALAWLGGLVLAAGAGAATTETWTSATSPDGVVTVSTPCSAAEVAQLQRVPASVLGAVNVPVDRRVLCRKGKMLLLAGTVAEPALPPGRSLFDQVAAGLRADRTAEGTPRAITINGRRAYANRQGSGETLAQTGFVEVSRTKVVVLVSGIQPDSGMSPAQREAAIDRFFASVRVTGK